MQARYYDPVIGRFYSNDPVGAQAHLAKRNIHGFNRYAYANNNPYKYVDPDGKEADVAAVWAFALAEPTPFGEIGAAAYTIGKYTLVGLGILSLASDSDTQTDETNVDEKNKNNQFAKRNKKEKNKNNPNKRKTQRGIKNVRGDDPNKSKAEEKTDNDRRNRATKDDKLKPKQEPKKQTLILSIHQQN
jgi:uncharacterized protein RhaS with RHS repeats